ncbi:MAG: zinc-binding alcohol dehydrogenase [Opitutaceae bacterium]|jgi:threonine dehydrogenase-like Zn-dependent dehydrogenase
MRQIFFTAHKTATIIHDAPVPTGPLPSDAVRGRTLVSLVSPGTELNWGFLGENKIPSGTGYACVFRVEEVGAGVTDLKPGTVVFASAGHAEYQQVSRANVTPLPEGLRPETGVFARLMGVSMSTLNTAAAHAPARVLVTGLGPVGNLAAQIFARCGYRVTAIDPVESRRKSALAAGLRDVRASLAEGPDDLTGKIALHLECSGHEQAVLDGCKTVAKRGEVVLVGVPWRKRTEITSFEILHAVFHRYVVLRGGWEWEIPGQPRDFSFNSLANNYATALDWLSEGSIKVADLATTFPPEQAQSVYSGLLAQSLPAPGAIFDWR